MKRVREKLLICLLLLGIFFIPTKAFAADWVAHLLPYSSVDEGEIRWGGSNWYSSYRSSAISSWNALGSIYIGPDDAYTYEDLHFSDVYRSDLSWAGLYTNWGAATDDIQINNYHLDQYSDTWKSNVFTHEIGHALALADIYDIDYSINGPWPSLMFEYLDYQPVGIQASDRDNYYLKW